MTTQHFNSASEIAEQILEAWAEADINVDKRTKNKILKAIAKPSHLADSVIEWINTVVESRELPTDIPTWLADIDAYFLQPAEQSYIARMNGLQVTRESQEHTQLLAIFVLLFPIVPFDAIVAMQVFSSKLIQQIELGFFCRLAIPRDAQEAERLFQCILRLPRKFDYYKDGAPYESPQAFLAQMLYVVLLMRRAPEDSTLRDYQINSVSNCPEYLVNYPDIREPGFSYRPAFWAAHFIGDPSIREILTQRSSEQYRKLLAESSAYRQTRNAAVQEIAPTATKPKQQSLIARIPESQTDLVALLNEFDELLKTEHPGIYAKLNDGVTDEQIDKLNALLAPLQLPDDLITLYKWHNGAGNNNFLFGFPDLLSLEDTLLEYRQSMELAGDLGWCRAWYPIAYESRVYWLATLSESAQSASPIYYMDIEDSDVQLLHQSVTAMIACYIEAYRSSVISQDDISEFYDIGHDAFKRLRLKYSPKAFTYPDHTDASFSFFESDQWPAEWQRYKI